MNGFYKLALLVVIFVAALEGMILLWNYFRGPIAVQYQARSLPPPANPSLQANPPAPEKPKTSPIAPDQVDKYSDQLADADTRQAALQQISMMAVQRPAAIIDALPAWVTVLLNNCQWDDALNLASLAITGAPQDTVALAQLQRSRAVALLRKGDADAALAAARSYFNVIPLADTFHAVDLLVDTLDAARAGADPMIVTRFKMQQIAGARPIEASPGSFFASPAGNVLSDLPGDSQPSPLAIAAQPADSFDALIGRANLLLLANRPGDAIESFRSALKYAPESDEKTLVVIEGVARSIRARSGTIAPANAFILSLRQGSTGAFPTADSDQIHRVAQTAELAVLPPVYFVPDIERRRQEQELLPVSSAPDEAQIVTGFECSTPIDVRKLSPTHFDVQITTQGLRDWFMFRLVGAAGKTIRIDISGDYVDVPNRWTTLNPVYADATDLADPKIYACVQSQASPQPAFNGPILPPTDGQSWHFISDVWREGRRTLSFVNRYNSNSVFIAMRVPYVPSFNERFLRAAAVDARAHVVKVGLSGQGRPLLLMQLGQEEPALSKRKPTILIYAREHADEHDSSWAAQGAIDYLLSRDPRADELLHRYTFLIIPLLDPDSAVVSQHEVIMTTFLPGRTTPESIAYADWFKNWIDAGNRLDLVFDLHNLQSSECPQVSCPLIEGVGKRGRLSAALNTLFMNNLRQSGYSVQPKPWVLGLTPDRLGGWLSVNYGPITLGYELNTQAPDRHLNLYEMKQIGQTIANSAGQFFSTPTGVELLAETTAQRRQRLARWTRLAYSGAATSENAIEAEALSFPHLGQHDITTGELLRP
jgi:tetratricopeptide (TPR) repeat protein